MVRSFEMLLVKYSILPPTVVETAQGERIAFTQEVGSRSEHLVSIRGTDKQLGDALVVLGKRIACKRVSVPKKKKKGTASSGPVNVAPSPSPCLALQNPSAPITPRQMATPTRGQARPSAASQTRAPQPSLPPSTPSSRTVVMASSSQSRDWSATPVVPSVHMASPDSMPEPLTPMDVDHIMAVTGWQNSDWPAQQRLELATRLWNRGVVVQTFDRWEVGEMD